MKIGAVTVTYNSGAVVDGFVRSMLPQTHQDFLLYVVDNLSSDDTLQRLTRYPDPRIRLIANPQNRGFADATNQGIRAALADGCDSVLLINNDTEFGPDLLERLAQGLERYACHMAAPKILYHDRQTIIWSAGGGFDRSRGYAGVHYGLDQHDSGQFDTPQAVEHAPACCLLVRKDVFDTIGLMDDRYFTYVEDTDFSYRAMRAGLTLMYLPSAILLHKAHSLTGGRLSPFSVRYITRNRTYFMLKHFGLWRALFYVSAYQCYLLWQLLRRQVSVPIFWIRQKALFEGMRLWRQSVRARV
jgi:GT2 family glycosyltransferase